MKIDVLVAEIGSTTTVVNAFSNINTPFPKFLGQGQAPTTVLEGDVNIGLQGAMENLRKKLGLSDLDYDEMLATSSAAGGLKMTVHGLVYDMTVRAAKEAALGAGAIIHHVTGGKLRKRDLNTIENIKPNLILIAGGVDFGERDTALHNANLIANMEYNIPVVYAGNVENQEEIREIYKDKKSKLYIVDNVYPKIDELNIEPTRKVIQKAFEEHIVHAPGMSKVRQLVTGPIIPTPGAVMEASKLLKSSIGDLVTIDVGGATTDIHSVTDGSEDIKRILLNPEPETKRTVEGDLGVYVNMVNIVDRIGMEILSEKLGQSVEELMRFHKPIPDTPDLIRFVEALTKEALLTAINRHVGKLRNLYGPTGKKAMAEGKDLTNIKWIVGTGGALTRLPQRVELLKQIYSQNKGDKLLPNSDAKIVIDNFYIMASLGVLSKKYPEAALILLKQSLSIE